MKFLDAILGRTPEVKANLDALFALPSAAVTVRAATGLAPSGQAAVCYKPATGRSFAATQEEMEEVLRVDAGEQASTVREESDSYGYHWVIVEQPLIEDLVTRAHMVNATLEGRGFGPQLLCSVFGLRPAPEGPGTGALGSGGGALGSGGGAAWPGGGA
ncbi:MAG: PspA-associated protein PspAB, partial [Acidimicrobiales bacterium]